MFKAKPYGYDALIDYRNEDWPSQIRSFAQNGKGVDYAYDCISEGSTVAKTESTLASHGKLAVVRSREGSA